MKVKQLSIILLFLLVVTACNNKQKTQELTPVKADSHPEWVYNATIYEVNIRQYTPEGTFKAFNNHILRLKDLGTDILWFMPIQTIGEKERKGNLGSYYSIKNYTEVNSHFGTLDDFKKTVETAHQSGMKVILDWVANHTSHDAIWVQQHPEWYVTDSLGNVVSPYDWSDVAKLNYDNQEMRKAMIDAMIFWIKETNIDGFRCDVAGEVPTDFWEAAVIELKSIKPDIFMLAEGEKPELNQHAFDAYYAWDLHHRMNKIASGEENTDSLRACLQKMGKEFPPQAIPMIFTSNHDENSWNGTEFERMGDAARTMAALSYTLPGIPLIYNGQEAGFNRRLNFFEKDSIDWKDGNNFTPFYQSLIHLRKDNEALWSQEKGGVLEEIENNMPQQIFSLLREADNNMVIAIFNLSKEPLSVHFNRTDLNGEYKNFQTNRNFQFDSGQALNLKAWEFIILYR